MAEHLIWDESPENTKEELITKQETTHSEDFDLDILEDTLKHILWDSKQEDRVF